VPHPKLSASVTAPWYRAKLAMKEAPEIIYLSMCQLQIADKVKEIDIEKIAKKHRLPDTNNETYSLGRYLKQIKGDDDEKNFMPF
jgi:hypothetical protein